MSLVQSAKFIVSGEEQLEKMLEIHLYLGKAMQLLLISVLSKIIDIQNLKFVLNVVEDLPIKVADQ